MDKVNYLPLGSLIIIKGSVRKVLIISRGLMTVINEESKFFDYGGYIYPEGLVGDHILYFNHIDIAKIIHEWYKDEDDEMMVDNINEWISKSDIQKGNPYELNQ